MLSCEKCKTSLTCPTCSFNEAQDLQKMVANLSAALARQKSRTIFISIGSIISVSISLALAAELITLKTLKDFFVEEVAPTILNPPSTSEQMENQIGPKSSFEAKRFTIDDEDKSLALEAVIECVSCQDRPLTMHLIDEEDFLNYQGRVGIKPVRWADGSESFVYHANLRRGTYHLVFYNSSNRFIPAKIRIDLSLK